jgi:hypothetical protein
MTLPVRYEYFLMELKVLFDNLKLIIAKSLITVTIIKSSLDMPKLR